MSLSRPLERPRQLVNYISVSLSRAAGKDPIIATGGLGRFAEAAAPLLAKDAAAAVAAADDAGADLGLLRTVVAEGPLDLTGSLPKGPAAIDSAGS